MAEKRNLQNIKNKEYKNIFNDELKQKKTEIKKVIEN